MSEFNSANVYSTVNADEAPLWYGYAANNIASLKRAVEKESINLKVFYTRLDSVLSGEYERRFCTPQGNFALFYPLDKPCEKVRY